MKNEEPGVEPKTPGLSHQCSARELRQPDNQQPPHFSVCTLRVVVNASVAHLAATQYMSSKLWEGCPKTLSIRRMASIAKNLYYIDSHVVALLTPAFYNVMHYHLHKHKDKANLCTRFMLQICANSYTKLVNS